MPASVEEHQTRNYNGKYIDCSKMLSEAPKKTKMKMKAAKVLKYLLNFLQLKSKRKHGDKVKLCNHSCVRVHKNTAKDVDTNHELFRPSIKKLAENIPSVDQIDKGLSLSWSYLVHEPFTSNLEGCAQVEEIDNGGIFYNESYFEDDYWQDFSEQDMSFKSPVLFGNESLFRLFEPKRTPCGEFKRCIPENKRYMPETTRRRHSSLPDFVMKESFDFQTLSDGEETDSFGASEELLDYNYLVSSHSQFALNIAFDNQLDETVCNDKVCSNLNQVIECTNEDDQILKCRTQSSEETLPWSCRTSVGLDDKQLSKLTSGKFETIAESSVQVCELFTDESGLSPDSIVNVAFTPELAIDRHKMFRCLPPLHQREPTRVPSLYQREPTSSSAEHISDFSKSSIARSSAKQCSLSGYSSSDNASMAAAGAPGLAQGALNSLSAEKSTRLDPLTDAALQKHSATYFEIEDTGHYHSPFKLPIEDSRKIQTITIPSSSSPMHFLNNSSHSRRVLTSVPSFLSPIGQNSEIFKSRIGTQNYVCSLRRNKHEKRGFLMDANLRPKLNLVIKVKVSEPYREDYHLLETAADLIVDRIELKEELKPYINLMELVEYLSSYYLAEISKLSNKIVETIADYKKIMQESMDTFHSDRLTQENCYTELLNAILVNRQRIVSECEDFIFENLSYFVNKQEYTEAVPEIVFLLLCNARIIRLDPLLYKISMSEVKRCIRYYLEANQTNFERCSRMNSMFSIVFDQPAAVQLDQTDEKITSVLGAFPNAVYETKMKTATFASTDNLKRIPPCSNIDLSSVAFSNGAKCTSGVVLSGDTRHQSSYPLEESTFSNGAKCTSGVVLSGDTRHQSSYPPEESTFSNGAKCTSGVVLSGDTRHQSSYPPEESTFSNGAKCTSGVVLSGDTRHQSSYPPEESTFSLKLEQEKLTNLNRMGPVISTMV